MFTFAVPGVGHPMIFRPHGSLRVLKERTHCY